MIAAIVKSIIYALNGITSAYVHKKAVAAQVSACGQVSVLGLARNEVEAAEAASV